MNATPNSISYMIAGYIVFAVVMAVYLVSLVLRFRSRHKDLDNLQELEKK